MHGLVSLLPEPVYGEVEALWRELERDFGLTGIRVTPFPHVSWEVAEDYDWERVADVMQGIARRAQPVSVRTAGLGLFTGERPVIFVPVVKTAALMRLHETIWEGMAAVARGRLPYYAPDAWVPHVSLAYEDVTADNVGPVLERLAGRSFDREWVVDNLSLIHEPTGEIGTLRHRFEFGAA